MSKFKQIIQETNDLASGQMKDNASFIQELLSIKKENTAISNAMEVPPAIGVFGESQCGKSYLISELTGGEDRPLVIPGVNDSITFQQGINPLDQDGETTGVVTRLSEKNSTAPNETIESTLMTPGDIMFSLAYGYYAASQEECHQAILNEEVYDLYEAKLNKDFSGEQFFKDKLSEEEFICDFNECLNDYIKLHYPNNEEYARLGNIAFQWYRQKERNLLTIDQLALLTSSLWHENQRFTKLFKDILINLKGINFLPKIYLPYKEVHSIIDAKYMRGNVLDSLSGLSLDNNNVLSVSSDDSQQKKDIVSVQCVVKEIHIQLKSKSGKSTISSKLDVLDFPGAVASASTAVGTTTDSPPPMTEIFKRGKLLYLFDVYCKKYDISILCFCSPQGKQAAPGIAKKMLNAWRKRSYQKSKDVKKTDLFVAFTKSDKLAKFDDNVEGAKKRLETRFQNNFIDEYGAWFDDWKEDGSNVKFQNYYFIRNKQALKEQIIYTGDGQGGEKFDEEDIRGEVENGETAKDILKEAYNHSKMISVYIPNAKSKEIFNQCFELNNGGGVNYLIDSMVAKFDNAAKNKKNNLYKEKMKTITKFISLVSAFINDENHNLHAMNMITLLEVNISDGKHALSKLMNETARLCPDKRTIGICMEEVNNNKDPDVIDDSAIFVSTIDLFIDRWISQCCDIVIDDITIPTDPSGKPIAVDFKLFFNNIGNFWKDKVTLELKKIAEQVFDENQIKDRHAIRKYLYWICMGSLISLTKKIDNTDLSGDPVSIPNGFKKTSYQYAILKDWENALPGIYNEHYDEVDEYPFSADLSTLRDNANAELKLIHNNLDE